MVNSLSPNKCGNYLSGVILTTFKWAISSVFSDNIVIRWMSYHQIDNKSTSFTVITWCWCWQATNYYRANVDPVLCSLMASLGHNELKKRHGTDYLHYLINMSHHFIVSFLMCTRVLKHFTSIMGARYLYLLLCYRQYTMVTFPYILFVTSHVRLLTTQGLALLTIS